MIDKLQGNIQHWRTKVIQLQRETDERIRLLKEEKSSIQKHYQQLKRRIAKFRESQKRRLLTLTEASKRAKTKLAENLQLAEEILRLNEHARNLETEQEKVLPFQAQLCATDDEPPGLFEGPAEATQQVRMPHQSQLTTPAGDLVQPVERLRKFYQRLNRAVLDRAVVEKERQRLLQENGQLHDMIKQYLDGLTIRPELLEADNPLLVINGRASLNRPLNSEKLKDTITKQDAAQIVAMSESLMP